jgi:hypothetical protein
MTDPLSDLDRLETEVMRLRDQLARLEQERADLIVELGEFELIYNARVGPLQARLEAAQLHIAEYQLRIDLIRLRGKALAPSQLEAEVEYRLREQRRRSETASAAAEEAQSKPVPAQPIDPALKLDLKQLYRELAKGVHPDLAVDEVDRVKRSEKMTQVNAWYAQQNLASLRQLLREVGDAQAGRAETIEQKRVRLQSEHDRLDAAIRRVRSEINELNQGALLSLKLEYALQKARGRDLLIEVAARTQTQLDQAERELNDLIARFRELIESTGMVDH